MTLTDFNVSVIIPVFNGESFLPEAIESVLRQDHHPIEIIVVDDGSTDGTAQIAVMYDGKIRYYYQENAGPAAARNYGIRMSSGDYIAFIDADDLWPEHKLRTQLLCFAHLPSLQIAQGLVNKIILTSGEQNKKGESAEGVKHINTNLGAMIVRRSVFDEIGFFDEGLRFHEDTDFWIRARESNINMVVQRRVALIYQIHERNLTRGEDWKSTGFLAILKKSINRRGGISGEAPELSKLTFLQDYAKNNNLGENQIKIRKTFRPLVSVIILAFNDTDKVRYALESVYDQNYQPLEIIVVSENPDSLGGYININAKNTHLIQSSMCDLADARNNAIEAARGEIIAFLDADGQWATNKLNIQVDFLTKNPQIEYVLAKTNLIVDPVIYIPPKVIEGLLFRRSLGDLIGTLVFRKSVVDQLGAFRVGLNGVEDVDWLLRAKDKQIPMRMLPNFLFFKYVNHQDFVFDTQKMKIGLLQALRSSIHRKINE